MYGATPKFWADDLRRHIDAFYDAAPARTFLVPRDILDDCKDLAVAEALTRRIVLRFGQLLASWGDIASAAARLREAGVRLAQPIEAFD
jgi:hypothetical protein